jgi:hypothetical protein
VPSAERRSRRWATLLSRAQAGQLSYQNLMIFAYYDMETQFNAPTA